MMLLKLLRTGLPPLLLCALLVAACDDDSSRILGLEPVGEQDGAGDTSVITVSEPVKPTRQVISVSGIKPASWLLNAEFQSSDADSLSYVSFSPGTFPDADSVEIVNLRTGDARVGRVLDGGLDPVAIASSVGDSLSVVVLRATDIVFRLRTSVPDRSPPVVVRTRPVRSATAVPLNSWIIIVFSEPVDISTISPDHLRLLRDGQPVPADLRVELDGLTVSIVPTDPLLSQTDYQVEILDKIRDLSGDQLELGESVPFTTVTGTPGPVLISVTAGDSHSCGLTFDGEAWCWGSDEFGQLGTDAITSRSLVPTAVETETRYSTISAGGDHTCALSQSEEVWCWGRNDFGQVGDGSLVNRTLPALVATASTFKAVTAGQDHSCARTLGDAAYCWGRNANGQLGEGSQSDRLEPFVVSGGLTFSSLSAGVAHTCGTTISGEYYCWGSNLSGQLSDPDVGAVSLTPNHPINSGGFFESMAAVAAGDNHSCALQPDGTAWCGGTLVVNAIEGDGLGSLECRRGDTGALMRCRDVMFAVFPELNYSDLTAGHEHSCSLTITGEAYCWGRDEHGQRGDGSALGWLYVETEQVVGQLRFAKIDAGAFHTCGITIIGETYCWGRNDSGQVGDGTMADRGVPSLVSS